MQRLRVDYWGTVRDIEPGNLIFLDESGSNLALTRLYARSLKGLRADGERPSQRGQNVSIVGAMSLNGMVSSFNVIGAYDGITFEAFVIRHLVPKPWRGACVIMDNGTIHKGEEIQKAIEKVRARLIFIPPYSPDFSPIENL